MNLLYPSPRLNPSRISSHFKGKWVVITGASSGIGAALASELMQVGAHLHLIARREELLRELARKAHPYGGGKCKVEQQDEKGIGQLWVSSQWTMQGRRNKWQNTGDLVYCNTLGYYFYAGRADKMVVCGGENIYPEVVERTLCNHPKVFTARVIPSENLRQGNRLEAIVELLEENSITEEELRLWLRAHLSRYEIPHTITFGSVKILETGKRK